MTAISQGSRAVKQADPWIPRWGNPVAVMRHHPRLKHIGLVEVSGGEMKHLSTPRKRNKFAVVAASEPG